MPTIKEKDGKLLTEKEAMAHREMVYNGVDSAPPSATALNESPVLGRVRPLMNPEDVVQADSGGHPDLHRAFSFEHAKKEESSDELYE